MARYKYKKAVSSIISYSLLIIIAIGLAIATYNYLRYYLPEDDVECPAETKLVMKDIECSDGYLNITLSNEGFFNLSSFFLRLGEAGREVLPQVNKNAEMFRINSAISPLSPGNEVRYTFNVASLLIAIPGSYTVELQPGIIQDGKPVPCVEHRIREDIVCT